MLIPQAIVQQQASATDGWILQTAALTRTGDFTFTEVGDTTVKWAKGTRFEYTQSGVIEYGTVISSSHAAGTTTVTLATNLDYAMAAGALDSPRYSYALNPPGYPDWFNYTPTFSGFSAPPTLNTARFRIYGQACRVRIGCTATGTSNATTFGFTLPVTVLNANDAGGSDGIASVVTDNSVLRTTPSRVVATKNTVDGSLSLDFSGATGWTASGTKGAGFIVIEYLI